MTVTLPKYEGEDEDVEGESDRRDDDLRDWFAPISHNGQWNVEWLNVNPTAENRHTPAGTMNSVSTHVETE